MLRVAERQPDPWLDLCIKHPPTNGLGSAGRLEGGDPLRASPIPKEASPNGERLGVFLPHLLFGRGPGQLASRDGLLGGAAGDGNRDFFRGPPLLRGGGRGAPGRSGELEGRDLSASGGRWCGRGGGIMFCSMSTDQLAERRGVQSAVMCRREGDTRPADGAS